MQNPLLLLHQVVSNSTVCHVHALLTVKFCSYLRRQQSRSRLHRDFVSAIDGGHGRSPGRRGGRTRVRGSTPGHCGGVRVSGREDPRDLEQRHHRQCQGPDPGQEGDPTGPEAAEHPRVRSRSRTSSLSHVFSPEENSSPVHSLSRWRMDELMQDRDEWRALLTPSCRSQIAMLSQWLPLVFRYRSGPIMPFLRWLQRAGCVAARVSQAPVNPAHLDAQNDGNDQPPYVIRSSKCRLLEQALDEEAKTSIEQ